MIVTDDPETVSGEHQQNLPVIADASPTPHGPGSTIDLSVVLPAHNEAEHIQDNLAQIVPWLEERGLRYEVIVVDDGSADPTYTLAREAASRYDTVQVVRLRTNAGKGFALKFGVAFTQGERVAFLDSDLDVHISQLGALWKLMEGSKAHIVIGTKLHPASQVSYPFLRRVLSIGYYLMVRVMFGLPVHDTQTGIKLFDRVALMTVLPRLLIKKFAFDLELLACANRLGFHIEEAPVVVEYRRSASRITWEDIKRVMIDTLAVFYRLRLLRYYDD
jgi:glycosyltransferase involved in cell wall biosynthesis